MVSEKRKIDHNNLSFYFPILMWPVSLHSGNNGGRKRLPAGGTWKGPKAGGAASGSFVEGGTLVKSRTSVPPGSVLFLAPKCIKIAIFSNNTTTTARGRNADLGLARSSVGRALSVLCSGSCLEPTSLRLYFCVILVRHGAYIRYVRLHAEERECPACRRAPHPE